MARKSRREANLPIEQQAKEPVKSAVWTTAIYGRLSIENSGKKDDGESIENQVEICREYVEEHPYLHLTDTYIDNGWTGTNTNRPEFQRLLQDVHDGKIKALVIKDFSRFSRDYIEAGNLLENVFPYLGVRFISVADRYDSFETDGSAESLLIPLKNLINDFYSRDISKKVSTAIHTKQLAGQHLPSAIPYGYKKSETRDYRFEVDEEVAPVVRRIFQMRADGMEINRIATALQDEGIPTPSHYRYIKGVWKDEKYAKTRWNSQGLKVILRNPTYTGDLVFGRMPTALYLGKPDYRYEPDESKWRILKDMHEPLVDRITFEKIQRASTENRKKWEQRMEASKEIREQNPSLFLGKFFCGDCGARMRYHRYAKIVESGAYECPKYKYKQCDTTHGLAEPRLKQIVWNAIQTQLQIFCNMEKLLEQLQQSGRQTMKQQQCASELRSVLTKINAIQGKRERLYEDYTEHILTPEDYVTLKKKYDDEYQALSAQVNALQVVQAKWTRAISGENRWFVHMQSIKNATELDRDVLNAVVKKIWIYETDGQKRIEVEFNYHEDLSMLQAVYEEMGGETVEA